MRPDPLVAGGRPVIAGPAGRRRTYRALGAGATLASALGYIGFVDPHDHNAVYPQCPFRLLTGWNCPACGGLRMVHDLLHGHVAAAVTDNVFLLFGLPLLAGWLLLRGRRGKPVLPMPLIVTLATATLTWTVLRNLPGFPLAPTMLGG
ncbi:DUF2752 domain-containing protein [Mycobacterium sp. SM1]|uniref:DUF2752 domain-containing protein n=1 Tax=Mycobacterium sp. SM1 TaxID=2816243 RepID=UPI001BCEF80D|nr:DUF2752 domain-containing protein [Mycobacterium sp. SM1]MBS4729616.1 DUF2752 domain-containing protein [Mycobacterium sp. SM1]